MRVMFSALQSTSIDGYNQSIQSLRYQQDCYFEQPGDDGESAN